MKRFGILLLCLCLALSAAGAESIIEHGDDHNYVFSVREGQKTYQRTAEPEALDGFYYYLNGDGTATITGAEKITSKLVIPSSIGPYPVTVVGVKAFSGGLEKIRTLVISEGITTICAGAFSGAWKITSVTLPDSLRTVGSEAFSTLNAVSKLKLPEHLESIGEGAFTSMIKLGSLEIPDSLVHWGEGAFTGCAAMKTLRVSENHPTLTVQDGVLYSRDMTRALLYPGGRKNKKYEMPESVTYMVPGFAAGSSTLTEAVLAPGLETVPDSAFTNCSKLKSVEIREGTEAIGNAAFNGCGSLTKIVLPEGLKEIGDEAFENCKKLKELHLPDSVETMGRAVFYGVRNLKEISVPANLTWYAVTCAYEQEGPESVTVEFPEERKLVDYAAEHRRELFDTRLAEDGATEYRLLEDGTAEITCIFRRQRDSIPETVDGYAVSSIGPHVYCGPDLAVTGGIPATLTHIGPDNFGRYNQINSEEKYTIVLGGNLRTIDSGSFRRMYTCTHLVIEEGVQSIGEDCFQIRSICTVELPASLESIGEGSFLKGGPTGTVAYEDGLLTVIAPPGSAAAQYCAGHGIRCLSPVDGTVLNDVPLPDGYTWEE